MGQSLGLALRPAFSKGCAVTGFGNRRPFPDRRWGRKCRPKISYLLQSSFSGRIESQAKLGRPKLHRLSTPAFGSLPVAALFRPFTRHPVVPAPVTRMKKKISIPRAREDVCRIQPCTCAGRAVGGSMGWIRQLFSRRRYDEVSESIREHLDEKIADLMDRGMTRKQAERSARREFGNVTRIEERSRTRAPTRRAQKTKRERRTNPRSLRCVAEA